ncbi:MAG: FlgD immunoglobulin-like domain containing protein [Oryzomonas sp.]|uniref:flagellar hook assembly protein FlgD n=1 Tax=Oryzomonas sp. TaxID=2855186 RepID=UPI00284AE5A7|nr:FlgD immunoglobulin-like domain containing protein [Oryzomonas sp.]MDR3579078.1 FlgD immunoglobulin-like domain containing protein [Oryzomonas sp.]
MVSNVAATTNSTAGTATTSTTANSNLNINTNDFLQLFIAQLQNQDPTAPQDPSQMLSQLAQMSQLEQATDTNTNLQSLISAQNSATNLTSASLIGKGVAATGNSISFDGSDAAKLQYNLSGASSASTLTIADSSGNTVKTATIGAQSTGNNTYTWDGTNNSGTKVAAGTYNFTISSTSSSGSAVSATTYTSGDVTGVSIASGSPVLSIGSVTVPLSDVVTMSGG